ncbi:MAG: EFR1 family ferrodoxin [Anaerolineae bacterium]|nr:EFR1 family ferrodoxin [Anaerolineae bacterium]
MTHPSIGLFYFSGTGNTEIVAGLLAEAFTRRGAGVEKIKIEDVLKGKAPLDMERHDLIGLGHPIHGFDTPPIVYEFIDRLPAVTGKRAFILKTGGDFIEINNGASKAAIQLLEHKGYDVFYDRIICMSSNWWIKYDDRLTRQLYDAAIVKAELMSQEVLAGKERSLEIGALLGMLARWIGQGEKRGAQQFGRGLRVTDACIECDKCINHCPAGNIRRVNGKIEFGERCNWCMRCIYACPQGAIQPDVLKFCVVKGGYDVRSIINDPDMQGDYVTPETRGYFRHFIRYIQDASI